MKILVTGGAGYIGSHTALHLIENGHNVTIVDNLSNSSRDVISKLEQIVEEPIDFYEFDLRDYHQLKRLFADKVFDAVIHFAGFKAVGESVALPVNYYDNNINTTLNLLKQLGNTNITKFVFSSSATVYGNPDRCPIDESFPISATNPYGRTKLFIEEILRDYSTANPNIAVSILRYFNPVGAHKSGLIGENPKGIPNNLVPYISQVAAGDLDFLPVYGDDYHTPDGTGIRDYIHIEDLAYGHIKALEYLEQKSGCFVHNLGTGRGYSVLEVIRAFERVSSKIIPYKIVNRRPGDIAECYADPRKAEKELGWKAEKSLEEMLEDTWNFQKKN